MSYYHGLSSFYVGEQSLITFKVLKIITYDDSHVQEWNQRGIIPKSMVGDVELHVFQKSRGGYEGKYSYNLRKYYSRWLIYSHVAWDIP